MPNHPDQQAVIDFLSAPESHDPDITAVERVDTHCSIVFLAGQRAYKLKRAVKFSYLDYSTPSLRRQACETEVALNRRTAPQIYLGVLPVLRRSDSRGLELGRAIGPTATTDAVDWVVEMRRFDQNTLFDRLCERGALTADVMRELADVISAFHASAEIDPSEGGRRGVEWVLWSNRQNLNPDDAGSFPVHEIDDLDRLSSAALEAVGDLLERRRTAGRVRLCHGDLHLRNICLVDGRPTLFDGIEFSRSIACIDVLYDFAFLLMDLEQRGRRDLANTVFNRYLDRSDEGDGLAALPLFLSARAAIRAHTTLAAAERQQSVTAKWQRRAEARHFLDTACRFLQPAPPLLIAIGGLSGSGKTTLAHAVAPGIGRAPGARIVRSDIVRKRMFGAVPEAGLDRSAYTPEVNERVYERLREDVLTALAAGHSVIADAVFARPAEREAVRSAAMTTGVPFQGFWLEAPRQELIRRVGGRTADASDATAAVVECQLGYDLGPIDWHRVDAGGAIADVTAAIDDLLRTTPSPLWTHGS